MRYALIFACAAVLLGCQSEPDIVLAPGASTPDAFRAAEAACAEAGGTFGPPPGGGNVQICTRTPADANTPCSTALDCEGACLARSRTCSPIVPLLGCNDVILSNGVEANVCVN
ncbi:MAG: hypothetical protein AAF646_05940 [Pseudomonadota bacterium]